MRILATALVLFAAQGLASASSYLKTDNTTVDPIQKTAAAGGGAHSYSGDDLAPYADLRSADLRSAMLLYANLNGADLTGANLYYADLSKIGRASCRERV